MYREAEDALNTLASQWVERFGYIRQASDAKDKTPPVMIIVCDNTDIAEHFFRKISGEEEVEDYCRKSVATGKKDEKATQDGIRARSGVSRSAIQRTGRAANAAN